MGPSDAVSGDIRSAGCSSDLEDAPPRTTVSAYPVGSDDEDEATFSSVSASSGQQSDQAGEESSNDERSIDSDGDYTLSCDDGDNEAGTNIRKSNRKKSAGRGVLGLTEEDHPCSDDRHSRRIDGADDRDPLFLPGTPDDLVADPFSSDGSLSPRNMVQKAPDAPMDLSLSDSLVFALAVRTISFHIHPALMYYSCYA